MAPLAWLLPNYRPDFILAFLRQFVTLKKKEKTMGKNKGQLLKDIIFTGLGDDDSELIPIIADGNEEELKNFQAPDILPILPLRNTVLFPGVVLPITVGRQKSLKLIQDVFRGDRLLGAVTQKDGSIEDPEKNDLYQVGTVAQILKILEMPDGSTSVIIQGKRRFEVTEYLEEFPYFRAQVNLLDEILPTDNSAEFNAVVGSLKDLSIKVAQYSSNVPPEATFAVKILKTPLS